MIYMKKRFGESQAFFCVLNLFEINFGNLLIFKSFDLLIYLRDEDRIANRENFQF